MCVCWLSLQLVFETAQFSHCFLKLADCVGKYVDRYIGRGR